MARPNWVSAPVPYDWRQECWQILLATGADPDGDDARHLNPGEALRAVEELRREAEGEGATLGSMVDALIAVIDSGAHPAEDAAIVVGQLIRWREAKYPEADRSADACEAAADAGITTPDPAHNPANPRSDAARGEDGTAVTPGSEKCKCGSDCEFPCWQRLGIAGACRACGCPPFPDEKEDE